MSVKNFLDSTNGGPQVELSYHLQIFKNQWQHIAVCRTEILGQFILMDMLMVMQ